MSNLIYLGLVVVLTAVGCTIIWLRQRKPTGVETGIDAFRRELDALAPDRNLHDQPYRDDATEDGDPG